MPIEKYLIITIDLCFQLSTASAKFNLCALVLINYLQVPIMYKSDKAIVALPCHDSIPFWLQVLFYQRVKVDGK
jgi:hypothetical protein